MNMHKVWVYSMKKIIIFSKNLNIGGMEKSLVTLLNNIDLKQYDVTLVLEKKEGILLDELQEGIKIVDYKLSINKNVFLRKFINFIKKLKFVIKNHNKYDCSINYATYSILCSQMSRISSKNNIIFIHSDYYNVYNKNVNEIKKFCDLIKLEKFKKIIFVSKHSKDNLINILPKIKDKSILFGNLIDYKNIQIMANEYIPTIENNKKNILFVGRLEEEAKGISKLIKANNKNKRKEKYNIIIVGDGPNKEIYQKMNESKNVIFIGEQKNPYPYIKASDYIIITSNYEGFPVVYNEANVLGTGIITTIPVEDEELQYKDKGIILLEKELSNYNSVIDKILTSNNILEKEKVDFNKINKNKIKRFYSIIEK